MGIGPKYVSKMSDAMIDELLDGDGTGDAIAISVLFRYKPYEPEMILQMCGAQFRLHGPGATEASWMALERQPLPRHRRQPRIAVVAKSKAVRAYDECEGCQQDGNAHPLRELMWADTAPTSADPSPCSRFKQL